MQKSKQNSLGIMERFAIASSSLLLSLVITQTLSALLLSLSLLFLLIWQRISVYSLLQFLRIPLIFALLGLLSIVLVLGSEAQGTVFIISKQLPLSITESSLESGKIVMWRSLNCLLSLYFIIATTTLNEKIALTNKLFIPKPLVELGILSFRYIHLLEKKRKEILIAQRLRLGYSSYWKSLRSVAMLLSTIFIFSIHTFRMNYQALLLRGYTGQLLYNNSNNSQKDRAWFIILTLFITSFLILSYKFYMQ